MIDVLVLSVARLAPEKGLDVLIHAVAEADDPSGSCSSSPGRPRAQALVDLAAERGVRLMLAGDLEWGRSWRCTSRRTCSRSFPSATWGVVVNEAAACGLPLVLSDRVGAAHDLLRDGENGTLSPPATSTPAARALRELAADPALRRASARLRELAQDWGYGASVEGFLEPCREAGSELACSMAGPARRPRSSS